MHARPSPKAFAVVSLVLVMLIWGNAMVVIKVAQDEVPPLLLVLLRFALASAILLPLAQARGGLDTLPRPLPIGTLALMGLTGVTLFFTGVGLALLYTTVSASALIQGAIPAVTASLAVLLLGERFSRGRALGIGLSVLGVLVLMIGEDGGRDAPNPLLGNLLVVGAVVAWSIYTILGKRLQHAPQLAVTTYSTLVGTLLVLPLAAWDLAHFSWGTMSAGVWVAVVYLGAGASALSFLLWNRALQVLDASQVGNFVNLLPLVGIVSAALFLGELPAVGQLTGGALVLAGVWLVVR